MRYEVTEKAMMMDAIIVQHLPSGDYLLDEYLNVKEAIAGEKNGMTDEEWGEGDTTIVEYDLMECEDAAKDGYAWPISLGLVEEVEEDNI